MSLELRPGGRRLLVVLHGHGDDPAGMAAHAERLDPDRRWTVAVPRGPVTLPDGSPAWFDVGDEADARRLLDHLAAVLDEAAEICGVPAAEAVVLGYSQGAAAALTLVAGEGAPEVAAVAGIAGWLPTLDGVAWAPRASSAVLLVHGADDEVVPLPLGRSAARFLERAGVAVTWRELDAGHVVTPAMLDEVGTWLASLAPAPGDDA